MKELLFQTINVHGQSLTEFLIALVLMTMPVFLGGKLLFYAWQNNECVYLVFKTTHGALTGQITYSPNKVQVTESPSSWSGEAKCGKVRAQLTLKKLDPDQSRFGINHDAN